MTAIRYSAARNDGTVLRGLVDAADRQEAVGLLVSRGLHPLRLEVEPSPTLRRPASRRELALLFRSLASLLEVGVPLDRALQATRPALRGPLQDALPELEAALREGASLSRALERTHGLVPSGLAGMVRAGERASRLTETLDHVATHLEQELEFLTRLRGALTYPLILLVTGLLSVGVITMVILPRFAVLLSDLGQSLPASTRFLLGTATTVRTVAPFLPLLVVGVVAMVVALLNNRPAMTRIAGASLALPVLGPLRHSLLSARWLRGFAVTLASGVPVLSALEAGADAAGDPALRQRTNLARERITRGESVATALAREAVLTGLALQVVAIGDASGQLARMAERAGGLAAAEGERRLRQFVSLLEPLLVLGFGAIVAFVAAALLQAVYAIRPTG